MVQKSKNVGLASGRGRRCVGPRQSHRRALRFPGPPARPHLIGRAHLPTLLRDDERDPHLYISAALIQPFLDDRIMLQNRLKVALEVLKNFDEVDTNRVASIGFCFGGLCVLDLARIVADLNGVVSFHGLLGSPGNTTGNKVKAKVLVLHGWDDPMATPDHVVSLAEELTIMGADWQIHGYGNTMHAFTKPEANDPDFGTVYQSDSDRRSWNSMQYFLSELFN